MKVFDLGLKNVSRLNLEDDVLFDEFIQSLETRHYCDSFVYILRATRSDNGELGYKFFNGSILFAFGLRNGTFYITRPLFRNSYGREGVKHFIDFILSLRAVTDLPIVLKKTDEILFSLMKQSIPGLSRDNKLNLITDEEFLDEKNLNLLKLYNADKRSLSPKAKRFRLSINRFVNKNIGKVESIAKERFTKDQLVGALVSLSKENRYKEMAYRQVIEYLCSGSSLLDNYYLQVFSIGSEVQGMYLVENFDDLTVSMYMGLTSGRYGGLTEYLDNVFFLDLLSKGICNIMLGGAETNGVDYYVNKLLPVRPEYNLMPAFINLSQPISAQSIL